MVRAVGREGETQGPAGSWAVLAARRGLSRSVGGGLEPRAGQVPGCTRMCEPQGCQLPAVSQGTVRQVSVIRFQTVSACLSVFICLVLATFMNLWHNDFCPDGEIYLFCTLFLSLRSSVTQMF